MFPGDSLRPRSKTEALSLFFLVIILAVYDMVCFVTSTIRAFMSSISLHHFVHRDFHKLVARMTLIDTLLFLIMHSVDKIGMWHRLPVVLGLFYLAIRRHLHQKYNLFNVGETSDGDGELSDPVDEEKGTKGTFFGRNILPLGQKNKLMKPDPMVVATKLLARRNYKDTGKQFNVIAASWIQFMIYDLVNHLEDTKQVELVAPKEVESECPLKSFKFCKTKQIPTNNPSEIKSGTKNIRTPWWDGSVIYGNNLEGLQRVRSFEDGKLRISKDGLLLHDLEGIPLSGDETNIWAGYSTLQALFVKEHNAICDALKDEYPLLNDDKLFSHARLVTSAVIAKIHTIDWTVELLKTNTLLAGMRVNWYGLLGKKLKEKFGHFGGKFLGGIVGLKEPNNHGVPYSLTEEFVSVNSMHSLLPDHLDLRDISVTPGPNKTPPSSAKDDPMKNLIGKEGEKFLKQIGFTKQLVSMGHQACGALKLWNYPLWLRDIIPQDPKGRDRRNHVDLPALEVYRDRERNVARYNDFRRGLMLKPIKKWKDLTDDEEAIRTLEEVYGHDVEELDLQVGLLAEKKINGFVISETAFVLFLLMASRKETLWDFMLNCWGIYRHLVALATSDKLGYASTASLSVFNNVNFNYSLVTQQWRQSYFLVASRRLEADKFFTNCFNEETYTKIGLEWVNKTESLKDVIHRHYPEITKKWINSSSAFSVWDSPPNAYNPIPLYLRLP